MYGSGRPQRGVPEGEAHESLDVGRDDVVDHERIKVKYVNCAVLPKLRVRHALLGGAAYPTVPWVGRVRISFQVTNSSIPQVGQFSAEA